MHGVGLSSFTAPGITVSAAWTLIPSLLGLLHSHLCVPLIPRQHRLICDYSTANKSKGFEWLSEEGGCSKRDRRAGGQKGGGKGKGREAQVQLWL